MDTPMPAGADKRSSTKDRLADKQNMSPKEIREYLGSDEFKHHGSKAVEGNARRLLAVMGSSAKQTTLDDAALMRDALSAIDRASFASGNEAAESIAKSRAYGYDPERKEDDAGNPDTAPAAAAKGGDDGPDDDDDGLEDDDEDDDDDS